MAVRTHTSHWRFLASVAPIAGVAVIIFAVLQGEAGFARSATVYGVLLVVSIAGFLIAWVTARQLRGTPVVAIVGGSPGIVSLRGRARPLPGAPLVSPDGVACVWFHHAEGSGNSTRSPYRAWDSTRPFLLTDDTGTCLVSPQGAQITGGRQSGGERYFAPDDVLWVTGQWREPSAQLLESLGSTLRANTESRRMIRQFDSPAAMQAAGDSGTATFSGADSQLASGASPTGGLESVIFPTLPVVDKPDGMAPFVIAADGATTPASTYAILARVDAVILVVAVIFMFVFS